MLNSAKIGPMNKQVLTTKSTWFTFATHMRTNLSKYLFALAALLPMMASQVAAFDFGNETNKSEPSGLSACEAHAIITSVPQHIHKIEATEEVEEEVHARFALKRVSTTIFTTDLSNKL